MSRKRRRNRLIDKPKVLLVEGTSEQRSIPYIMEANGVTWPNDPRPVELQDMEGRENITRSVIQAQLNAPQLQRLGVIIDADQDAEQAWRSLQSHCAPLILDLPEAAPPEGFIGRSRDRGLHFGLWIMPNNQRAGMLEDLLLAAFKPEKQPLRDHTEAFVDEGKALGASYNPLHRSKAMINAWIALEEPGEPLWREPVLNTFDLQSPSLTLFVAWFRRLFDL